jgi:predicted NBD/HSP70 family sugar kinase
MNNYIWGIDLGGTKIEGVVLENRHSLKNIVRKRVPTEAEKGYEHILQQIHKLLEMLELEAKSSPKSIGIGTPGSIDPYTNNLKNSNTTCLNGKPLQKDLAQLLGIPVFMANDANCFAVAEANLGAVPASFPNAEVVFGVIMGTGVGGGVVFNGKGWNGNNGIGGEWGHNFLDDSGGACYCGKSGCVERVISGTALEQYYFEQTGIKKKLHDIVQLHQQQMDSMATATVQRLLTMFGKALSVVINILDPDVIVIGGGVGNIDLLYTEGRKEIEKNVFNPNFNTPIIKPKLGDSAGVFGAALLTPEQ